MSLEVNRVLGPLNLLLGILYIASQLGCFRIVKTFSKELDHTSFKSIQTDICRDSDVFLNYSKLGYGVHTCSCEYVYLYVCGCTNHAIPECF